MDTYDRTLLLVAHSVPPAGSWWVWPPDWQAWHEEWLRQLPRLLHEQLPPGVERALEQAQVNSLRLSR